MGESLFERPFPRIRIMTRFRTSIAAVAFLALASARAADWPTYRGDYARSGVSTQSLAGIPVVSWTWRSKHPPQPAWQGEAKWDGWNKVFAFFGKHLAK